MRSLFLALLFLLAAPPAHAETLTPAPEPQADRLGVGFGKGVSFESADGRVGLQLRARAQLRYTGTLEDGAELPSNEFVVRRMRLLLKGHLLSKRLEYYLQLGFAASDMESDLRVPLRDAYITWTAARDLSLRFGQMKVPYGLQRRVSSGALQFADRSLVTTELNLDRDTGLVLFSNDLGGKNGLFGYQAGLFGGDGRNRSVKAPGLLVVGRLQLEPLGGFDELVEGGFDRSTSPRLMLGAGAALNFGTRRSQSTLGESFEKATFDYLHLGADLLFKWHGFTFQSEWMLRRADRGEVTTAMVSGDPLVESARQAWGLYSQAGYAFTPHVELAARYGRLRPLESAAANAASLDLDEAGAVLSAYLGGHDLKLQTDLFRIASAESPTEWRLRSQLQFWF
jgi:phosphate-selective porin OprO/OprP